MRIGAQRFTLIYFQFPDFEKVIKDLKDIRTIMLEAEQGKYKYVFALVADLRLIVQSCKLYLSVSGLLIGVH